MISRNRAKLVISLQKRKVRESEGLFVVEGDKIVKEFLNAGIKVEMLFARGEFTDALTAGMKKNIRETEEVTYEELKRISSLKTPHNALAVIPLPEKKPVPGELPDDLCVALDFIQDPGNLGTIIRAAAWFGIRYIICSPDCADIYNPKVIQSTMGAILHVDVHYTGLRQYLDSARQRKIPVYGTMLDGQPVYGTRLAKSGVIILGNESRGISADLTPFITHRITIPGANKSMPGIDSLNVSMAASIVFSEFFRQTGDQSHGFADKP